MKKLFKSLMCISSLIIMLGFIATSNINVKAENISFVIEGQIREEGETLQEDLENLIMLQGVIQDGKPVNISLVLRKKAVNSSINKEKNIEIVVDLPSCVNHDVTVTGYINGVLDSTKTINPFLYSTYSMHVKGKSGKKTINVNVNGSSYRVYEVDFDTSSNNVKKLKSYNYNEASTQIPNDEYEVYGV